MSGPAPLGRHPFGHPQTGCSFLLVGQSVPKGQCGSHPQALAHSGAAANLAPLLFGAALPPRVLMLGCSAHSCPPPNSLSVPFLPCSRPIQDYRSVGTAGISDGLSSNPGANKGATQLLVMDRGDSAAATPPPFLPWPCGQPSGHSMEEPWNVTAEVGLGASVQAGGRVSGHGAPGEGRLPACPPPRAERPPISWCRRW